MSEPSKEALEAAKKYWRELLPQQDEESLHRELAALLDREIAKARLGAMKDLASAIKKVCPEVIPQIIEAVNPEEEFIKFMERHSQADHDAEIRRLALESFSEGDEEPMPDKTETLESLLTKWHKYVKDLRTAAENGVDVDEIYCPIVTQCANELAPIAARLRELVEEAGVILAQEEITCGMKHVKTFQKLSELREAILGGKE